MNKYVVYLSYYGFMGQFDKTVDITFYIFLEKTQKFIHQVYSPLAISVSINPNLLYFFLSDMHLCMNYKILEEVEGKMNIYMSPHLSTHDTY